MADNRLYEELCKIREQYLCRDCTRRFTDCPNLKRGEKKPRLVDANAVIDIAMQYCTDDDGSCSKADVDIREMLDEIECLPTVDAESVRHGHWDDMGDFEQCSVCHGTHLKVYQTCYGKMTWVNMSYCPHCGAKMEDGKTVD